MTHFRSDPRQEDLFARMDVRVPSWRPYWNPAFRRPDFSAYLHGEVLTCGLRAGAYDEKRRRWFRSPTFRRYAATEDGAVAYECLDGTWSPRGYTRDKDGRAVVGDTGQPFYLGAVVCDAINEPRPDGMDVQLCHGLAGRRCDAAHNVSWGDKATNRAQHRFEMTCMHVSRAQLRSILTTWPMGETDRECAARLMLSDWVVRWLREGRRRRDEEPDLPRRDPPPRRRKVKPDAA